MRYYIVALDILLDFNLLFSDLIHVDFRAVLVELDFIDPRRHYFGALVQIVELGQDILFILRVKLANCASY